MRDHRQDLILAIAKGEKLAATGLLDNVEARQLAAHILHLEEELAAFQAAIDRETNSLGEPQSVDDGLVRVPEDSQVQQALLKQGFSKMTTQDNTSQDNTSHDKQQNQGAPNKEADKQQNQGNERPGQAGQQGGAKSPQDQK